MSILRIDKVLSEMNICSRSQASKAASKGLITLNGEVIKKCDIKINTDTDKLEFSGKRVEYKPYIYLVMNKPSGFLSATEDKMCKTVIDLVPNQYKRQDIFPAGRLDKDTEGLLIITNDGEFAHNMLSPNKRIDKLYYAKTDKPITESMIEAFSSGIELADKTKCLPAKLEEAEDGCYVTICEGKFHQVKKMLARVGLKVLYLKRLSIGGLCLDKTLLSGECREMTEEEKILVFLNKK